MLRIGDSVAGLVVRRVNDDTDINLDTLIRGTTVLFCTRLDLTCKRDTELNHILESTDSTLNGLNIVFINSGTNVDDISMVHGEYKEPDFWYTLLRNTPGLLQALIPAANEPVVVLHVIDKDCIIRKSLVMGAVHRLYPDDIAALFCLYLKADDLVAESDDDDSD